MKTGFLFSLCFVTCFYVTGQKETKYTDYHQMAKDNLIYLDKMGTLSTRVKMTDYIFELYAPNAVKPEIFLPWTQVGDVVAKLETGNHHEMYNGYNKTLKELQGKYTKGATTYHPVPTSFQDLNLAIDPGHFAGNFKEAIREDKYVKIKGATLGLKKDIEFYEAELNDMTAIVLQFEIEKLGGRAFTTKGMGQNSLGISFREWYQKDFKRDLEKALIDGDIDKKYREEELIADTNRVYNHFFRFIEMRKRIDMINSNNPSVTIAIHYNAMEGGKRDEDGFLMPVQRNYSMAFVPGAFLTQELNRPSEKLDFMRLLFSPDLDESIRLANLILEAERTMIGVSQVPAQDHVLDDKYCTLTKFNGVYCRNLAMTRTVRGPIVYLEALLQDNDLEAVNLSKKDFIVDSPRYGRIAVPERCVKVAQAIVRGIGEWLNDNKSYVVASSK